MEPKTSIRCIQHILKKYLCYTKKIFNEDINSPNLQGRNCSQTLFDVITRVWVSKVLQLLVEGCRKVHYDGGRFGQETLIFTFLCSQEVEEVGKKIFSPKKILCMSYLKNSAANTSIPRIFIIYTNDMSSIEISSMLITCQWNRRYSVHTDQKHHVINFLFEHQSECVNLWIYLKS